MISIILATHVSRHRNLLYTSQLGIVAPKVNASPLVILARNVHSCPHLLYLSLFAIRVRVSNMHPRLKYSRSIEIQAQHALCDKKSIGRQKGNTSSRLQSTAQICKRHCPIWENLQAIAIKETICNKHPHLNYFKDVIIMEEAISHHISNLPFTLFISKT